MNDVHCPICNSTQHQDFWYWDKEELLTRMWAMDTRVHFSICRECAVIFQNPLAHSASSDTSLFSGWEDASPETLSPTEPMEWLRQFMGRGKTPGKALEIFHQKPYFHDLLKQEGWDIQSVRAQSFLQENGSSDPMYENPVEDNEEFDLVFCFSTLEKTENPTAFLNKIHDHVKTDGGIYVQVSNPYNAPRYNQLCLTSEQVCVFPFQTLIFCLYKAGFTNQGAEVTGINRCFCTKIEKNPEAEANKLVPTHYWEHITYRFQRNYSWAWTTGFLDRYLKQSSTNPDLMDQTREMLRQRIEELDVIRDVCGAVLLFVQEIDTVRNTLDQDWHVTMSRIFDVFNRNYALYELLNVGSPTTYMGTMPDIERFYVNEKIIYMTNPDYFKKYFSQEEAAQLCEFIIQAGSVVCKNLSSFL